MSLFVDTSAWFAAVNRKDAHHQRAVEILTNQDDLITSEYVFVEAWLLIKNRTSFAKAQAFWSNVARGSVRREPVSDADLDRAWLVGQSYSDQHLSLVDLTSFVVMERLGVSRVVSFDDDFIIYRYGPGRSRAFEVLR